MRAGAIFLGVAAWLAAVPATAAVYEVSADGSVERLDAATAVPAIGNRSSATRSVTASTNARKFQPLVAHAGAQYGVSPALIDAIAHVESRYNPGAVSPAKAVGIMQLMPATAREMGVDARDAGANIRGGTAYLRHLLDRFDGDLVRTIAAYNAGPGAVIKAGGVPNYRETRVYVAAVLDRLAASAQ